MKNFLLFLFFFKRLALWLAWNIGSSKTNKQKMFLLNDDFLDTIKHELLCFLRLFLLCLLSKMCKYILLIFLVHIFIDLISKVIYLTESKIHRNIYWVFIIDSIAWNFPQKPMSPIAFIPLFYWRGHWG